MTDVADGRPPVAASWCGLRVLVLSPTPTHPQDFGNRKRVYSLCSALKTRGASITFVHYPAEGEWRNRIPGAAELAMRAAWDACYTVPVTRPLHSSPVGRHHTADEWWDEAIGGFLTWLFGVASFDVFIVNYTWLSKALTFAPPSVVKLLDTNDRFAGRREILESHGIAPEFFYTTDAEEALALDRADIVWAIKDEEKAAFRRISSRPVHTLLHLDEPCFLAAPEPDPEGYLRVGIIGARNNVNSVNITNFFGAALPRLEAFFAPVRILVAGSICDELSAVDERFVTLLGRVESVESFYRSIDVACVPVEFSTGLKIKVGEALSFGVPVISLAHAFEGYVPKHRAHRLGSFRDLADEIVELAFDPRRLSSLRAASLAAYSTVQRSIYACLEATLAEVHASGRRIVFCVDATALLPGSLERLALESSVEYLRYSASVTVIVVSGSLAPWLAQPAELATSCQIMVCRHLVRSEEEMLLLAGRSLPAVELRAALDGLGARAVFLDSFTAELLSAEASASTLFFRPEFIRLRGDVVPDAAMLTRLAGRFAEAYVVARPDCAEAAAMASAFGSQIIPIPAFHKSRPLPPALGRAARRQPGTAVVLAHPAFEALEFAQSAAASGGATSTVVTFGTGAEAAKNRIEPSEFADQLAKGGSLPAVIIDLSFGLTGLQLVREFCERAGVSVIQPVIGADQIAAGGWRHGKKVATYFELYEAIRSEFTRAAASGGAVLAPPSRELESDGGWAWIWVHVTGARRDSAAADLGQVFA